MDLLLGLPEGELKGLAEGDTVGATEGMTDLPDGLGCWGWRRRARLS
jgi:hypothetical protein